MCLFVKAMGDNNGPNQLQHPKAVVSDVFGGCGVPSAHRFGRLVVGFAVRGRSQGLQSDGHTHSQTCCCGGRWCSSAVVKLTCMLAS